MSNLHLFHTVWWSRNAIKKIQYSAVLHYDALPVNYKIIRTKDELFSQYKHKTNSFQLDIFPLTRQMPYKVLNPIILCTVCVLYHSNYHVPTVCIKWVHKWLCGEKLGNPQPKVNYFLSVNLCISPAVHSQALIITYHV